MRGGAKALSKAELAVALVAKKADNTDGFELIYKSINDIQANEFHVATSIDGRQSQEFLGQTKKHLDKKAVKNQVDELAKAKNLAPTVAKWVDEIKDVSLLKKIESLNADDLAKLEKDFLSRSNGNELKKLITTADDLDKWKLLKDDPHYAFELAQENPNWEKWAKSNFFKEVTKKGKDFEINICLQAFKNRKSIEYLNLKQKFQVDFGKNLDDYDMYNQVQLKYDGDNYFVADQIFVKYKHNEFDKLIIEDILVIENKLNRNTLLTTPQKEALKKSSYIVRNIEPKKSQTNSKLLLNKNDKLNFENSIIKWYKVYDGEDGKIIKGIDKL